MKIDRNARPQDVTWFIDQMEGQRLDLTPPYQRKSVWNIGDRMFFIETVLLNFPCPAVFLYKDINEKGKVTYQVIDGRQRLETVLDFVQDKFPTSDSNNLPAEARNKLFSALPQELKLVFWNYSIPVEMINSNDGSLLNDIFDRLNRNNRKLNRQELRNARFEGGFFSYVSKESEDGFWGDLSLFTKSAISRMDDQQYISELVIAVMEEQIMQFDQDMIDEYYSSHDIEFADEVTVEKKFKEVKRHILEVEKINNAVSTKFRTRALFYSLWCYFVVTDKSKVQQDYTKISEKIEEIASFSKEPDKAPTAEMRSFLFSSKGASTDKSLREKRQEALVEILS